MMPIAVIGLVIEAMRNSASLRHRLLALQVQQADRLVMRDALRLPTTVTAPATVPSSTNCCIRGAMAASLAGSKSAANAGEFPKSTNATRHNNTKRSNRMDMLLVL